MAINPLQLPGPIQQPQVDWSRLDAIGDTVARYRQDQRETDAFGSALDAAARGTTPAAPTLGAPPPAAAAGGVPNLQGSLPRGIRNNNPGNIEDGTFAKALPGYKGSDGRFAIFESPEHGLQAMDTLLTSYGRRGLKTVNDVISRWAPSADGNNVSAYAQFVANGGDPNAPIDLANPEVRRTVATRMAQFENGQPPVQGGGSPAAPAQPGTSPAAASQQQPAGRMGGDFTPEQAKRLKALYAAGGKGRDAAWGMLMKLTGPKDPVKMSEGDVIADPNQIDPATGQYRIIARAPGKQVAFRPGGGIVQDGQVRFQAPGGENKVEQDVAARRRIAQQLGQENDPQMKIWVLSGKHPGEDRVSPTQLKMIAESEDENLNLQGTKETLARALELNDKIYSGFMAKGRAAAGTQLPDWMVPDIWASPERSQMTEEWSKLMEPEALQTMARTLKGATTDFELRTFVKQLADPSTTPQTRKVVLEKLARFADRNMQVNQTRMDQIRGGTYSKPGGGQSNVVSTNIPGGAVDQLKANPSRQARQQFDEIFGSGEAAKILGAGQR